MRRPHFLVGFSILLGITGCQNSDEQIRTYRISKEASPSMPMTSPPLLAPSPATPDAGMDMNAMGASMGMKAAASSQEVTWAVPAGWREMPPSSMRIGSFLAKASNGHEADISVIPLSGEAGGDLSNINRWRSQINLAPISDAELPQISQTISAGGLSIRLVDMVSREPLVDNRYPKRIMAAIYKEGTRSWFFKMIGEDKAVQDAKPAFLQFLQSLRFHGPA